ASRVEDRFAGTLLAGREAVHDPLNEQRAGAPALLVPRVPPVHTPERPAKPGRRRAYPHVVALLHTYVSGSLHDFRSVCCLHPGGSRSLRAILALVTGTSRRPWATSEPSAAVFWSWQCPWRSCRLRSPWSPPKRRGVRWSTSMSSAGSRNSSP